MAGPWLAETVPCPACDGTMEPEEDFTTRWMACTSCGYENAWQMVKPAEPGCALGVPASIRRRAQAPQPAEPVFLGSILPRRAP